MDIDVNILLDKLMRELSELKLQNLVLEIKLEQITNTNKESENEAENIN